MLRMLQRCLCYDSIRRRVNTSFECKHCCYCCLQCCKQDDTKENYIRIENDDPDEPQVSSNGMSFVPVQTIFQMSQHWKRFTTHPQLIKTPNGSQEMRQLPPSEDSVVNEPPKTVTYGSTESGESQPASQQSITVHHDSSDEIAQPATLTESATEKTSLHLQPEDLSSQSKVSQAPILAEEDEESSPSLHFSLHYDVQRRTMTVHLKEASNLPAKDRSGTSDPFVVMHLHPNKEEIFESKIVYKTLNPVFNQSFEFHNLQLDDVHRQSLVFRIYNHYRFSKNNMIGGIVLPLKDVDVYGGVYKMRVDERVENFRSKESKGDILISLEYQPKQCVLDGMILKVTNLEKQDVSGLADPYVKVYLLYRGKRVSKWKSSVKKNTLVATFNEPFQFSIESKDINDVKLEVVIMDYDRFSRNDLIGTVLLGANVDHQSGFSHWTDVVATPEQGISRWHSIKPNIQDSKRKTKRQKFSKVTM